MKYGNAYGGADPEMIEGDIFRIVVKVPEFGNKAHIHHPGQAKVHDRVHDGVHDDLSDLAIKILACCRAPIATPGILDELGYKTRTRNFRETLNFLIDNQLIEMTIPDKPRSKKQQYRLTENGRNILDKLDAGNSGGHQQ